MNKILVLFILIFGLVEQSRADDIRDFQIEGMSIGNSLLDFFKEKTIKKNTKKNYYSYKKNFPFVAIEIQNHKLFKEYNGVQFHVKKNDTNYRIHGISGYNYCEIDINNCYNQTAKIEKDFLKMFTSLKVRRVNFKHDGDPSKKSNVKGTYFTFYNGDEISINVYDWSKESRFTDNYDVSIDTNELTKAFQSR